MKPRVRINRPEAWVGYFVHCVFLLACAFSSALDGAQQVRHKMYCMYTPQFEVLCKEFFLPSLKDDFEVIVSEFPQDCPLGTFRSEGWDRTMLYKLELLQRAILENWGGQVFFYSDIDIIFFKPILELSLGHLGANDFVVQQGWPRDGLCAGFFVMRGNGRTLKLIAAAHALLLERACADDQVAIQTVLDGPMQGEIDWEFLPSEQFPNGRRVLKQATGHYTESSEIELDGSIALFHANCCIGLDSKYHFLRRVQELYLKNQFLGGLCGHEGCP